MQEPDRGPTHWRWPDRSRVTVLLHYGSTVVYPAGSWGRHGEDAADGASWTREGGLYVTDGESEQSTESPEATTPRARAKTPARTDHAVD